MQEFHFDYTNPKTILKLLGMSLLVFVLLVMLWGQLANLIGGTPTMILLGGAPFLVFWLSKKRIKERGSGIVADDFVEFKLRDFTRKIAYADIKDGGIRRTIHTDIMATIFLRVRLKNNSRFRVHANQNFCDPREFDVFCLAFQEAFERFGLMAELKRSAAEMKKIAARLSEEHNQKKKPD
jgi:hypothetical protein